MLQINEPVAIDSPYLTNSMVSLFDEATSFVLGEMLQFIVGFNWQSKR